MSDQSTTRSPDEFVKRAPTPTQVAQQAATLGTGGSTLGLVALYINECLTAHHLVAPSTEMILVLLGLCVPMVTLIWQVANAKLTKWAQSEGVTQGN